MIEQRSEAWFEARRGRVTASMVGAILGLSPYMTRSQAMRVMVRSALGAEPEFAGNAATEWGTAMEAMAIGEFEDRTGLSVKKAGFITLEDWAGCSPDGLIDEENAGIETKCPYGIRNDPDPVFRTLAEQPHYLAQVQFSLYVTGRERWYFEQWTPHGNKGETVMPDQAWRDDNLPRLRQFHAEFLSELENPAAHLEPLRQEIDTPQAHKMVAEWDELSEAIERAEERKKDLLAELTALAGEQDAIIAGRKLTKVERAGSVSYAKVVKEKLPGLDLAPWTGKPSSHWRLS